MYIEPFGVELWMNEFELKCDFNLAETCCDSISIDELLAVSELNRDIITDLFSQKMTYGAIEGSKRLRTAIAALYKKQSFRNTLVTHGTIGANSLVYQSLLSRDDKVISIVPSYQQHYSIPASVGANVTKMALTEDNQFLPDIDQLAKLTAPDTKLIALTNPNNPTGSLIHEDILCNIADIARKANAWVLCDEVYRGIDQNGSGTTASIADLYEKGISTAGMSKAFSLAGLRLGWLTAPLDVIEAVMVHRDYNTISVGIINDFFASVALENAQSILDRNRNLTRTNVTILDDWINTEPMISWVKPKSVT